MARIWTFICLMALTAVLGQSSAALADSLNERPITLVVPFAAGGPTDRLARQLAKAMRPSLGDARIVVENVAGAGGTVGAAKVARATPDGHTILIWHIGMASASSLYRKLPFQPLDDFEYLGMINDVPMTLLAAPRLPANNYAEFIDYIRSQRGRLQLAHAGPGSASHLCGVMWMSSSGLQQDLTPVAYRGTGPAMSDLITGQVDLMCDQTTNTTSQIKAGRAKAFAVTTLQPLLTHELFAGYPTLDQVGLKGFNLTIWHGLYAPKGTPQDIVLRLNQALRTALNDPAFQASQAAQGASVVTDERLSPQGHKAFVRAETEKFRRAIVAAGAFAD